MTFYAGHMSAQHPHLYFYSRKSYNLAKFYIYFLKSLKDDKLYFGSTSDLRRRLSDHNTGKVPSTKTRRPFELRYYEAFTKASDAKKKRV